MEMSVHKLDHDLYCFTQSRLPVCISVDAYLVLGSQRCLLIDCLMLRCNLYQQIREITDLPLDVLITHGHPDHAGMETKSLYEHGAKIYMNKEDYVLLASYGDEETFGEEKAEYQASWFTDIHEDMSIDLGDKQIMLCKTPGHSPGCIIAVDQLGKRIFCGDTYGSGEISMQWDTSLALHRLIPAIETAESFIMSDTSWSLHPGHRFQCPNGIGLTYLHDLKSGVERLISGKQAGCPHSMIIHGKPLDYRIANCGEVYRLCYNDQKL